MHINFQALFYYQNIVKADKQETHKHLIANLCNDPDHSEPFDITLLVPAELCTILVFETAIDQLSITAQGYSLQSAYNLNFQLLY